MFNRCVFRIILKIFLSPLPDRGSFDTFFNYNLDTEKNLFVIFAGTINDGYTTL